MLTGFHSTNQEMQSCSFSKLKHTSVILQIYFSPMDVFSKFVLGGLFLCFLICRPKELKILKIHLRVVNLTFAVTELIYYGINMVHISLIEGCCWKKTNPLESGMKEQGKAQQMNRITTTTQYVAGSVAQVLAYCKWGETLLPFKRAPTLMWSHCSDKNDSGNGDSFCPARLRLMQQWWWRPAVTEHTVGRDERHKLTRHKVSEELVRRLQLHIALLLQKPQEIRPWAE